MDLTSKLARIFSACLLSLIALALMPQPGLAQGPGEGRVIGGYARINRLERKISPPAVYLNEPFYATIEASVTLVKDLPMNIEVQADYIVVARPEGGGAEVVVGKGSAKTGPFPSVKAGVTLEFSHQIDMAFPPEAVAANYDLYLQPVRIMPWVIWFALDAFPSLRSARLGSIKHLGKKLGADDIRAQVDESGVVQKDLHIVSPDGRASLTLLRTSRAWAVTGRPLERLGVEIAPSPTPPPGLRVVGQAYNFQPQGAYFDPPARLELAYQPGDAGAKEPFIAYLGADGSWVNLETERDVSAQLLVARVSHLTVFAILAPATTGGLGFPWLLAGAVVLALLLVLAVGLGYRRQRRRRSALPR